MYRRVFSAQTDPSNPVLIKVEINKSSGVPQVSIVGLPDKAVEESKDRVSSALENAGFVKKDDFKSLKSVFAKITISLAPANVKKSGALFDVPIAIAYLSVMGEIDKVYDTDLFIGELGLNGEVLPVTGVISAVKLAKDNDFKRVFVPKDNIKEASLVKGIDIYPVSNIEDLVVFLREGRGLERSDIELDSIINIGKKNPGILLDDIKGQEVAKRGLTIAGAGGHNIAFYGPPGTGKSMLARVFSYLLPPLDYESVVEVTAIHSSAGEMGAGEVITHPPIREPHHSSSYVSLVGGGANIKPGEITLAHKGVLFLDEFPEFDKRVINALREPLESNKITVSRASGTRKFPADFILIVALNPCPCGYFGTQRCVCTPSSIEKYQAKISGPIADRIDMWVKVDTVKYDKLLSDKKRVAHEHKEAMRKIKSARLLQKERFGRKVLNSRMSVPAINKYVHLSDNLKTVLNGYAEKMNLSGRAYHKVIKVAQTIADIENTSINESHLLEALGYRERK